MKIFKFLVLITFVPSIIYAQSNFHEGYIIKNNGDTVKGYINVQEWNYNPQKISFKTSLSEKEARYSPLDIKSFRAELYFIYTSYVGAVSNNRNYYPNLDQGLDTTSRTDTVFLRQIVAGNNVSLYKLETKSKTNFFYRESEGSFVELKYYQYFEEGSQTSIKVTAPYVYQLWELSKRYGSAVNISQLQRTNFNETEISKVFRRINNDQSEVNKKAPNTRFFVGVSAGSAKNWFEGVNRYTLGGKVNAFSPKISLGFDAFNNPVTQRLILRGELFFSYNNSRIQGTYISSINPDAKQFYEIKQYTAGVAPNILFNAYSTDNFKFFIGGGFSFNVSFYPVNRPVIEGANSAYSTLVPYELKGLWVAFPISAGVVINKRFEIAASYVPPAQYTNYTDFSIKTSSISAGIKYFIGKK